MWIASLVLFVIQKSVRFCRTHWAREWFRSDRGFGFGGILHPGLNRTVRDNSHAMFFGIRELPALASWIVSQGIELGTASLRDLLLDDHVLIFKVGCVEITGGACAGQFSDAFRVLEYTHIFTPLLMSFVQGPKITFIVCFQIAKDHCHCQQKHW